MTLWFTNRNSGQCTLGVWGGVTFCCSNPEKLCKRSDARDVGIASDRTAACDFHASSPFLLFLVALERCSLRGGAMRATVRKLQGALWKEISAHVSVFFCSSSSHLTVPARGVCVMRMNLPKLQEHCAVSSELFLFSYPSHVLFFSAFWPAGGGGHGWRSGTPGKDTSD